jgi:hypothetical protein
MYVAKTGMRIDALLVALVSPPYPGPFTNLHENARHHPSRSGVSFGPEKLVLEGGEEEAYGLSSNSS